MGYVNHGGEAYSEVNCAFCTVAAIFNTDSITISQMMGLRGHQSDGSFAKIHMARRDIVKRELEPKEHLEYDLAGVKDFVQGLKAHLQSPVYVSQGGSYDTMVPMPVQIRLMRSYPVGTQFAVYACVDDPYYKGIGAHWNYAERTVDGLEFRDYQYNDSEDNPPKISETFIPPKAGENERYGRGIVLVFRRHGTSLV
ncbi:MAG: hypothetical protein ACREQN_01405 [Candidatus Binataceae bacterium]